MYVGTLTEDEFVFSGLILLSNWYSVNDSYLFNEYSLNNKMYLLSLSKDNFVNFSEIYDQIFIIYVDTNDYVGNFAGTATLPVISDFFIRPSVNLKSSIEISRGNGTQNNPYVIK